MILILTSKQDSHSDEVIRELNRRKTPVFRLNTEDLLVNYLLDVGISQGQWFGSITDQLGRVLDLSALRVAWLRKPNFHFNSVAPAQPSTADFIASEARAFIHILYSLPQVTWVNDPFQGDRSRIKFQQLILASRMGIAVPDTLITNQTELASRFFERCGKSIATKAIYNSNISIDGVPRAILTAKVAEPDFIRSLDSIPLTPTQLQNYVEKEFELRVTVVGDKVFAAKIDSQVHDETRVDWRARTGLNPHSKYQLPANVEQFCVAFLQSQKIHFGAMDFIVTPGGEYVFLENNPYGQYQWIEQETGYPLSETICDLLERLAEA